MHIEFFFSGTKWTAPPNPGPTKCFCDFDGVNPFLSLPLQVAKKHRPVILQNEGHPYLQQKDLLDYCRRVQGCTRKTFQISILFFGQNIQDPQGGGALYFGDANYMPNFWLCVSYFQKVQLIISTPIFSLNDTIDGFYEISHMRAGVCQDRDRDLSNSCSCTVKVRNLEGGISYHTRMITLFDYIFLSSTIAMFVNRCSYMPPSHFFCNGRDDAKGVFYLFRYSGRFAKLCIRWGSISLYQSE